jgi:hypothetical protein
MSDEEPLHAGFVRRRRFLIVVSVALALADYLGLQFDKVDVLGNSATVHNPAGVMTIGRIVWILAFIVYVQWFNDVGAWAKTKAAYSSTRNGLLMRAMRAMPVPPALADKVRTATAEALATAWRNQGSEGEPRVSIRAQPVGVMLGLRMYYEVHAWIPMPTGGEQGIGSTEHFDAPISKYVMISRSVLTFALVVAAKRYFSEYFAPFLIALLPLAVPILRI